MEKKDMTSVKMNQTEVDLSEGRRGFFEFTYVGEGKVQIKAKAPALAKWIHSRCGTEVVHSQKWGGAPFLKLTRDLRVPEATFMQVGAALQWEDILNLSWMRHPDLGKGVSLVVPFSTDTQDFDVTLWRAWGERFKLAVALIYETMKVPKISITVEEV